MKKTDIYKLLGELCDKNYDMVLINDEKVLAYKDIDDDTLGLDDYSDDDETDYKSFEVVKELENDTFLKEDGTILETETFNPFGGMIIGYKVQ